MRTGEIGNLALQASSLLNANPKDNIALARAAHPLFAGNRGGWGVYGLVSALRCETFRPMEAGYGANVGLMFESEMARVVGYRGGPES